MCFVFEVFETIFFSRKYQKYKMADKLNDLAGRMGKAPKGLGPLAKVISSE